MSDLVTLNVGGSLYTTTVATLTRYPDSMLGRMFSGPMPSHRDSNGHYIIDKDGPIFRHVLNFLRHPSLCLPHDFKELDLLSAEADFYQIKELMDEVKSLKEKRSEEGSRQEMEFIEISFSFHKVTYRGTVATLKNIQTLLLHFIYHQSSRNQIKSIEEYIDAKGWISAQVGQGEELNRMKIYQEITQVGFRLLKTSIWDERIEGIGSRGQITLFGRYT